MATTENDFDFVNRKYIKDYVRDYISNLELVDKSGNGDSAGFSFTLDNQNADANEEISNDLTIPVVDSTTNGLMNITMFNKLNGIATEATKDSALTEAEILAVLV